MGHPAEIAEEAFAPEPEQPDRATCDGGADLSRRIALSLLAVILLGGGALRLWMLSRDVPTVDSDEATFGLMALHMLHGEWTAVMWGQTYMGSLESMVLAPLLWLFGTSTVTLRLAPMLIGIGFIGSVYALSAWLYSRRLGLICAALLAFGPPFFVVLSVRTFGGYVETLLCGNLLLLLALHGATPSGRGWRMVVLTGLVAGVALWTDFLIGPYLVAVALIYVWQRRRDLLGRSGLLLAGATLAGVLPIILFEVFSGGGTARAIATSTLSGTGTPGAPAAAHPVALVALHNPLHELFVSLPILLGGGLGGTQSTGLTTADYLHVASNSPLVYDINLLLVAAAVGLVAGVTVRVVRGRRAPRVAPGERLASRGQLRHQFEAAVLLICACYGVAVLVYRDMNFAAPRYLLPFFAATPLLVGQAERTIHWAGARLSRSGWFERLAQGKPLTRAYMPGAVLIALCCLVIAWNIGGDVALRPVQTAALDNGVWVYGDDVALLSVLRAAHIRTIITDSYWTGMRLSFKSGETLIPVIQDGDGNLGLNRYPPYVAQGKADLRPAYVELAGTPGASLRRQLWQTGHYPQYSVRRIGLYDVYLPA